MKDKRKYADRAEYLKAAVTKRRKTIRQKAIKYKGGKCELCGYNRCIEALEFHHISNKCFGISQKGYTRSWNKVKDEIDTSLRKLSSRSRKWCNAAFRPKGGLKLLGITVKAKSYT